MYTKRPPQKRGKTYRKKHYSGSTYQNWVGEETDVFLWKVRKQENWEISTSYIRKCYFFSWLFENHPVLHKIWLNFEMRLPSLKFLEPHSDRLQSSFYRWSLLTHLETENVYTQKKKAEGNVFLF